MPLAAKGPVKGIVAPILIFCPDAEVVAGDEVEGDTAEDLAGVEDVVTGGAELDLEVGGVDEDAV